MYWTCGWKLRYYLFLVSSRPRIFNYILFRTILSCVFYVFLKGILHITDRWKTTIVNALKMPSCKPNVAYIREQGLEGSDFIIIIVYYAKRQHIKYRKQNTPIQ